jgi:hypothetical protein
MTLGKLKRKIMERNIGGDVNRSGTETDSCSIIYRRSGGDGHGGGGGISHISSSSLQQQHANHQTCYHQTREIETIILNSQCSARQVQSVCYYFYII